jgi:hypothetical protein
MPELERPNAPAWLKVLVALHVICITIWALPNPGPKVMRRERAPVGTEWLLFWNYGYLKSAQPVRAYLLVTGFWQYWDMFSPDPAQEDIWVDAEITYRDKTVKRYQYPRMFLLSIPDKFVKERFRKFYERVNSQETTYFWAPFAQRIAYLNDDPNNPPVTVAIKRHWLRIEPPGKTQPTKYNEYLYYIHTVDPRKLDRDRKGP